MYLTQAIIADDPYVRLRVSSCAAQQGVAGEGSGIDPDSWTLQWRRVWASSPGWDVAWESAMASQNPNPGGDPTVITDAQILSQVQAMMPFIEVEDNQPQMNPLAQASREFVMHQMEAVGRTISDLRARVDEVDPPGPGR